MVCKTTSFHGFVSCKSYRVVYAVGNNLCIKTRGLMLADRPGTHRAFSEQ